MVASNEEDIFTDFRILLSVFNLFGFTSTIVDGNKSRKYLVPKKWHYLIHVVFRILTCMCGYGALKILFYSCMHDNFLLVLEIIMWLISFLSQDASND